jgi:hypothetical protein
MLAAVVLLPGAATAQRAEGSFQRTITVTGPAEIEVVSGSGRIEVRPGSGDRIEVTGRVQANDDRGSGRGSLDPAERVRRIEARPPIEQSGNVVRIGHIPDEDLRNGVSISYTLTVPAASSLSSKTGSGSQDIEGIGGRVVASTGSGSLTFRSLGGDLRASSGSGSISADVVGGAFHATTGSGSIRAAGVTGRITAKTGSGDIDVTQAGSGGVDVGSSSGAIRARGVRGDLQASTSSGTLDVQGELSADWQLSSSSGSITIGLPAGQGFNLDASTGSGRISTDFPVTVSGTVDRRSLKGMTPGGGPLLRVRTSSGGISIQRTQSQGARH